MARVAGTHGAITAILLYVLALAGCATSTSTGRPPSFATVREAAHAERFTNSSLVVEEVDLGAATPGANTLSARITNRASQPLALGLDIRTTPGMWFSPAWQRQFAFDILAGQTQVIKATYEFTHLTPEATVRLRLGPAMRKDDGPPRLVETVFERVYSVGERNAAVVAFQRSFRQIRTRHMDLFAVTGSLAASRLRRIGAERAAALRQIANLLAVTPSQRIRLVFYPDAESKTADTWHKGAGLARENTLVEIYSVDTQLDPYHELAHILANQIGNPPALLNEGFATYVSERLGAFALQHLGHPGKKINQVVRSLASTGQLIPLTDLVRCTEIGSEGSKPTVAYPEAASIVGFLIETHGLARFREGFAVLANSGEPDEVKRNEAEWLRVFGQSIEQTEAAWRHMIITGAVKRPNRGLHPTALGAILQRRG
jgi:hypothetical protein